MDLDPLADLLTELAKWRETEQAALQDVEDADAQVIALDLRFQEAKRRAMVVTNKVRQLQAEVGNAITEMTDPPASFGDGCCK